MNVKVKNLFLLLNPKHWRVVDENSCGKLLVYRYESLPYRITRSYLDRIGAQYIYVCEEKGAVKYAFINGGVICPIKIFYMINGDTAYVSDDARYFVQNAELDALLEFLSFGYVLSNRTLIKNLYVIQAGEIIEYKDGVLTIRNGYLYDIASMKENDEKELLEKLWDLSKEVFEDVIKWTREKTIVVPLSGGYDSRFIVSMLKLLGAKNVICLSYGIKGNNETPISRRVAEKLGYQWYYLEYSLDLWLRVFKSNSFLMYIKTAHKYHTTPNIQEFMSTYFFKKNYNMKNSVVFIPGHTGDFISGGHISLDGAFAYNIDDLAIAILKKHYLACWPPPDKILTNLRHYLKRLLCEIGGLSYSYQLMEIFDWRERQSKYIVNSIGPYAFFGYSWLMPLWNRKFVDFWASVPLKFKINQSLYRKFLYTYVFGPLGVDFKTPKSAWTLKEKGISLVNSTITNSARRARIYYHLIKLLRKSLPTIHQKASANPCGFDNVFPLFYQHFYQKFATESNTIKRIKQINGIHGYGANPTGYFTDAVAILILNELSKNLELVY
jgi:asparagine synthase (glutamine-hydrolysing)